MDVEIEPQAVAAAAVPQLNGERCREFLALASVGDAKHDFKKFVASLIKFLREKQDEFSSGLPAFLDRLAQLGKRYRVLDEATILNMVLDTKSQGFPQTQFLDADGNLTAGFDIDEEEDECSDEEEDEPEQQDMQLQQDMQVQDLYNPVKYFEDIYKTSKKNRFLPHNIKTISDYEFSVKGCSAFVDPGMYVRHDDTNFKTAHDLIEELGIKHKCAFVIDAMPLKILEILKNGDPVKDDGTIFAPGLAVNQYTDDWFTIFIIDCVETRSDPAGKLSW